MAFQLKQPVQFLIDVRLPFMYALNAVQRRPLKMGGGSARQVRRR